MTETFGIVGLSILAATAAAGIGIVGLVVWVWFGNGDDEDDDCEEWDEGWYDRLKEQNEMKEKEDDGNR